MVLTPVTRIPSEAVSSGIVHTWAETGRSTTIVGVVMGHALEQGRQGFDAEIADVQRIARRGEDVHAARMAAGEDLEQSVVESLGLVDDFLDLEFRRDVQIVADVAGLEVEVDEGNLAAFRRLAPDELDGRFDRERRIADAAGAGQERDDDRLVRGARPGRSDARDDAEDFLGRAAFRDPVGVPRLDQLLVVPGGQVAADDDEEHVSCSAC